MLWAWGRNPIIIHIVSVPTGSLIALILNNIFYKVGDDDSNNGNNNKN